jgi:hypothetical protein
MWKDYAVPGGTFRENLRRQPGQKTMPDCHYSSKFKYENLKEKYADEFGDIVIDRKKEAAEAAAVAEKLNGLKSTETEAIPEVKASEEIKVAEVLPEEKITA